MKLSYDGPNLGKPVRALSKASLDIGETLSAFNDPALEIGNPGHGTIYRDLQQFDLVVDQACLVANAGRQVVEDISEATIEGVNGVLKSIHCRSDLVHSYTGLNNFSMNF